jgi:hypothetical protein
MECTLLTRTLLRYTLPFQFNKNVLIRALRKTKLVKFATNATNKRRILGVALHSESFSHCQDLPPTSPSSREKASTLHLQEVGLLSPIAGAQALRCRAVDVSYSTRKAKNAYLPSSRTTQKPLCYLGRRLSV